jgi:hypothetical protein
MEKTQINLDEEFVLYPEAFALKELGFDEPCFKGYFNYTNTKDDTGNIIQLLSPKPSIFKEDYLFRNTINFIDVPSMAINHKPICNANCSAPLYQQAFKWFRKNHKLQASVNSFCFEEYSFNILGSKNEILYPLYNKILNDGKKNSWEFDTYEEAELECLKKLIHIVKTK